MIVSCHVPKTAGTTFGKLLQAAFGDRVVLDYGDRVGWTGPEAEAWRAARGIPAAVAAAARSPGSRTVVHGHFHMSKYARAFPAADLVAFIREPVDRVISNYHYLARNPQIAHPLVAEFHRRRPTLPDWAEWPEARNLQSTVLDVPLRRIRLIGLTERFTDSLRLFDAAFGTALAAGGGVSHNVGEPVEVSAAVRMRIAWLNREDVELYQRAVERFERSAAGAAEDQGAEG